MWLGLFRSSLRYPKLGYSDGALRNTRDAPVIPGRKAETTRLGSRPLLVEKFKEINAYLTDELVVNRVRDNCARDGSSEQRQSIFRENQTMRIRAIVVVGLFAAICANAQAPTQEQINQALIAQHDFFDNKTNQTLSRCSDKAWALMRYEGELTLLGKKGPQTTAQEVMEKQSSIDKCKDQAAEGSGDLWSTIASMLKMQEQGGDFVNELREQLKCLEKLSLIQTLAGRASEKIFRDHLYDSQDQLQARYDKLVPRYNAIADSLAAVPLPSTYERPRRLHCETTNNRLGEWSTITTDCQ